MEEEIKALLMGHLKRATTQSNHSIWETNGRYAFQRTVEWTNIGGMDKAVVPSC